MKGLNIECLNIAEYSFHSSGGPQSHNSSWDLYFLKEKERGKEKGRKERQRRRELGVKARG